MESIQKFTYADYANWDTDERVELIEGIPYLMSPGPMLKHQSVSFELARQLGNFLHGKSCKAFTAPFDVRLNAETGDDTVLQPDLFVVCDRSKLDGKACIGAPDFVIEILSPASVRRDRHVKFRLYQRAGVREYWIVDPDTKTVSVYVLEKGRYIAGVYADADDVPVSVLDGCVIHLADVFAE